MKKSHSASTGPTEVEPSLLLHEAVKATNLLLFTSEATTPAFGFVAAPAATPASLVGNQQWVAIYSGYAAPIGTVEKWPVDTGTSVRIRFSPEPVEAATLQWRVVRVSDEPDEGAVSQGLSPERDTQEEVTSRLALFSSDRLEDGNTAELGNEVSAILAEYGEEGLFSICSAILSGELPAETASHVLRWLGRIEDRKSLPQRRWVLGRALWSPSPLVRDGAALGLGNLGGPRAIHSLRSAALRESSAELKRDMEHLIDALGKLENASAAEKDR